MHARRRLFAGGLLLALMTTTLRTDAAAPPAVSLETLSRGQVVSGFRSEAVYLDDADAPFGGRFVHERTGFTLDYLRMQSVPQAFMWVTTYPTSDKGEPHTQEHLLLGKGNKGRSVAGLEDMALVRSTAYTEQTRTCYHFHTGAGPDVFFRVFEARLDALLNPDYTDEEVRREVRNFGVAESPTDRSLRLEEKGTVYNEMVSSFERPGSRLYRAAIASVYGAAHPLALSSGGHPAAIREMTPDDIRRFHREHYFLANMGMIASFPKEVALETLLARFDGVLTRLDSAGAKAGARVVTERDLPAPAPAPAGTIRVVDYPAQNPQTPGTVLLAWPAQLDLDARDRLLLQLFLANFAGDATTNLYKAFVDTKTRTMDVGARGVYASYGDDLGNPVYVGLVDVAAEHLSEERVAAIRDKVREEIARVASWPDGSPELAEFNARMQSRVTASRRALAKFVNSPPGFGFRGNYSSWLDQLELLARGGEFRRSVTLREDLAAVERLAAAKENAWRAAIARWRLLDSTPYGAATRANPALIEQEERERGERVAAELARLKAAYGTAEDQEAIRRFRADYDATTAELERLEKSAATHRFVDSPPMTLDDQLEFEQTRIAGVPAVVSRFDNMTSATAGAAFRLDGISRDDLVYLSLLPQLMTSVGVIENGKPVGYEEMAERLRREILSLNASFSVNPRTSRYELVVRGAGNTVEESERAVEWMRLVAATPDWRPENLARIRDLVDQTLAGLRKATQAPEEQWVNDPAAAWFRQDRLLYLATGSFLTRAHFAHRLRWLLMDPPPGAERDAAVAFFTALEAAAKSAKRAELEALLAAIQAGAGEAPGGAAPAALAAPVAPAQAAFAKLSGAARKAAVDAAADLAQVLPEIPDDALAADWSYLAGQMRRDLLVGPAEALAGLERVRREVVRAGNARLFLVGSEASRKRLERPIAALVAAAGKGASSRGSALATERVVEARLRERVPGAKPLFVGLLNPNTRGGVFVNSAPIVTYESPEREALLDYVASKLYGGGGAHGIFMKTWGAGLAYSNGVGGSPSSGRLQYYAERCPELPQTIRFVIDELKRAPRDPALVEYAVAQVFLEFRSPQGYESRGESMAADLADGVTPERVRAFRKAVLDLRSAPGLADALYDRMLSVYGRVLPGLDPKSAEVRDGVFFVIGPEQQLDLYEEYLRTAEGPDAKLYRLTSRDYWIVAR